MVGPSGAGKDTLMSRRAACADERSIVFPRRVVTREASGAEDNEQMSLEAVRERGGAALSRSLGCARPRYGVPRGIAADIGAGRTVVATSRAR